MESNSYDLQNISILQILEQEKDSYAKLHIFLEIENPDIEWSNDLRNFISVLEIFCL